jgi:predicted N-acetyltransferase YhbS
MRIEIVPEHALCAATDAAIGALMDHAFGPGAGYGGRSHHKLRHHLRVLGWQNALLIGHVALQLRAIRLGGRPVTIAGVGEVAVHPDHRGAGIGTALMRAAIAQAKGTLADFAVLFGYPGLYAPLGFQPQRNPLRYLAWGDGPGAVVTDRIESLMVLPLGPRQWDGRAEADLLGPLF